MRFMLMQNYGPVDSGMGPMYEWSQADIRRTSSSRSRSTAS